MDYNKPRDGRVKRTANKRYGGNLSRETHKSGFLAFKTKVNTFANGYNKGFSIGLDIVKIIGFILLFAMLFSALSGTVNNKSFIGLLNVLETAPSMSNAWLNFQLPALGDWGVFNFLRDFFNGIGDIFYGFCFLLSCIGDCLVLILWFVRWLVLPV